jgi:hypothetical protein
MTISQTRTIDWLGIEKETGHISLTLVDDLDWEQEQAHLVVLQEKLNTYLAFIESGELFERLAVDVGRDVPRSTAIKVTILAKFAVTPQARAFLSHAANGFRQAGFSLSHRVVGTPLS